MTAPFSRRTTSIALVLVILLGDAVAVVAAGDETTPTPPPPAPAPTPGLTLHDPGAEPRALLVYQPAEGATGTVTISTTTESTVTVEETEPMAYRSVAEVTMGVAVTEVLPDGSTRTEMSILAAELTGADGMEDRLESMMRAQLESMVGLSSWTVVDPSGHVIETGSDVPASVDPMTAGALETAIDSLSTAPAPFPAEPIGVGAAWTSVTVTPASELATASIAEVVTTITAIEGRSVAATFTVTSTSEPGPVTYPGMPDGSAIEIVSARATGSGEWRMDLSGLNMVFESSTLSTTEMLVTVSDLSIPMTTTESTLLRIESE